MALQLYSLIYITMNGRLMTEEFSVNGQRNSNSQPVATVAKGYAGESPGAATTELDITSAVPADGFEFNAQDNIQGLIPVECGVIMAGQQMTVKCFIVGDTFKHAVNSESSYDFKLRGPFARFE